MCIEDIRLARGTKVRRIPVTVGLTSTLICAGSSDRIALICPVPQTNDIHLMPDSPAIAGRGIKQHALGNILVIDVREYGQLPMSTWYGLSDTAPQTVDFWEVVLTER